MRKWILAFGVLLVGLLAVGQVVSAAETQVYRNEVLKSEIVVPKDWKTHDDGKMQGIKSPDGKLGIVIASRQIPSLYRIKPQGKFTLDVCSEQERDDFLSDLKKDLFSVKSWDGQSESGWTKTKSGHSVAYVVLRRASNDIAVYSLVLIYDKQIITLYAMGLPGEAFDKNREKLESMAKTLKVG